MKISWYMLFSRIVSTFIACCDTSLCWARVGICLTVTGGALAVACARVCHLERARTSCNCWSFLLGVPMSMCGMGLIRGILGTPPGVFALVWCRCMRGVFFKALFAVGLRACMMGGALVIHGMVRIGVSSITLCCSSLTLCCSSVTLCSYRSFALCSSAGGGAPVKYASRCYASSLRTLTVRDFRPTMAMFSWSSAESSLTRESVE